MTNRQKKLKLRKIYHSTAFSVIVMLILIGILAYAGYSVTKSYEKEVDFGGVFTIRQSNMGVDYSDNNELNLTRIMIYNEITKDDVLTAVALKYGWEATIEEMKECIDIRERLSDSNSFVIMVNSNNIQRSNLIARDLSYHFLAEYQKKWKENSQDLIALCSSEIESYNGELQTLKDLKKRFQVKETLQPLSTEAELLAVNEQLLAAQTQFLNAYGLYVSRLDESRFNVEMELALAKQMHTEKSTIVKSLQRKLEELTRKCENSKQLMDTQTPEIYRMEIDYPPLVGFPNDIVYFYENIKKLQQLKLSLLLDDIIEEKDLKLKDMLKKKNTIERLLNSNSCDVFIREVN